MAAKDRPDLTQRTSREADRREFMFGAAAAGAGLLMSGPALAEGNPAVKQGSVTLKDGTRLNYLEAGRGRPVVLVPGWSQTAAMFADQLSGLSADHRVIAVDMRGHGDSSKPKGGYRMARLAQDLHEFLDALDFDKVSLGGHSLGASVIWSYFDHFGSNRLAQMIIIDQGPTVVAWPGWSDDEKAVAGATFTPQSLYDLAVALAGPDGTKQTEGLVKTAFFTKSYPAEKLDWIVKENLKFPRDSAAKLLVDHCCQDWRDVIPKIRIPTIVFGGTKSIFSPRSQQWIASQIPDARAHIFEESEGGSHFMFMENPQKFNKLLLDFLS
jgi:non-heme chloroperoxidase